MSIAHEPHATAPTNGAPAANAPVAGIGWNGQRLDGMLADSERLFAHTGHYRGLRELPLKESDPVHFEKIFSRVRGGIVSARETALNISASPIVRELGEICFALYTPDGDNVALSTGIIVHVHTMSEAIKFMARHGWEDNPEIRPGDIFANNQPTIGDVHNADVQTFVPIFNPDDPDELIGWAGGVIHVMDIGASTPGGIPIGPVTRFEDGIDFHCMKLGERDTLAQWHTKRVSMQSRAPGLYLLDEKTRLAGCHMIRSAVERIVVDEGADAFKQFMREAIEDGRRAFEWRVRSVLIPGRYRSPAFTDIEFADRQTLPRWLPRRHRLRPRHRRHRPDRARRPRRGLSRRGTRPGQPGARPARRKPHPRTAHLHAADTVQAGRPLPLDPQRRPRSRRPAAAAHGADRGRYRRRPSARTLCAIGVRG